MTDTHESASEGSEPVSLTAGIVSAYVSKNSIPLSELPLLIKNVHDQLLKLGQPAAPEPEKLTPHVPVKKSVTPDYLISLEDGRRYKTLKRHLSTRGLTPDQYRQKWGLPPDYPMAAPNYAVQRSELAKSFGLGQQRRKSYGTNEKAAQPAEPKKGARRPRKTTVVE